MHEDHLARGKGHDDASVVQDFELRAGDCAKPADCSVRRERVELGEGWRAPPGAEVRYRIKLFVPGSYPELSPKQILGQWHDGANPVLSNRYERGRFWVDLMTEPGRTTSRFPLAGFAKGMFVMRDDFDDPLDEFAEYR